MKRTPTPRRRVSMSPRLPTLRLAYRSPLAWKEMLTYLRGRAIPGVEWIDGDTYARTLRVGRQRGWLEVRPQADEDALEVRFPAPLAPHAARISQRLRAFFDLEADPAQIAAHLRKDPRFRASLKKCPGLRVPGAWDFFELAARAILGQQISVVRATKLSGILAEKFGQKIRTPIPELNRLGFTARALAASNPAEIASIGLPRSRARTLHELATGTVAGRFDFPPDTASDEILATLQSGFGIGPWTANYIAMRALRMADAFPTADLGLLKATGASSGRELEALSQPWRPWRAYAALHLWQSS